MDLLKDYIVALVIHNTVIHFRLKFREFSGFRSTETSLETSYGFDILKFKISRNQHPKFRYDIKKNLCKTNNFGLKTRNFGSQKHEISVLKNTKYRLENRGFGLKNPEFRFEKPEVSIENPKFRLENPKLLFGFG
jgi:hypothetical protein